MPGQYTFSDQCYDLLRRVPRGKLTTYRELASALGSRAYRAVGQAMRNNPFAPEVPCHRVVRSSGEIGGYAWGSKLKIAMLKKEGVKIRGARVVGIEKILYRFKASKNTRQSIARALTGARRP